MKITRSFRSRSSLLFCFAIVASVVITACARSAEPPAPTNTHTFSGTYSQQNGFSIKLSAITQAYCGEASLDQQYTHLLNAVAAGGTDGQGNLALETAGGEQRLLFKNG